MSLIQALARPFNDVAAFGFRCAKRIVELGVVERAIVLAAQMFSAAIPLLLIAGALAPGGHDIADTLIDRFHLTGPGAASLRQLFLTPGGTRDALTWVSIVVVLYSAVNFTRTLQRSYERAWSLTSAGLRASWRGLVWLLSLVGYIWLTSWMNIALSGVVRATVGGVSALILSFAFWLWTPRVLLGPRIPWRRLVPAAVLTAIVMAAVSIATPIVMPRILTHDAQRYGVIGAAFSLLTWLIVVASAVMLATAIAVQIEAEPWGRRIWGSSAPDEPDPSSP
jgi:membrane protein